MNDKEELINFNIFQTKPGYTQRWIGSLAAVSKEQALQKACDKYIDIPSKQINVVEDDGLL